MTLVTDESDASHARKVRKTYTKRVQIEEDGEEYNRSLECGTHR